MIFQIHPLHGKHIAYNITEANYNNNHGWVTVNENEFYNKPAKQNVSDTSVDNKTVVDPEYEKASLAYIEKFGKPPHHRMKTENILREIDAYS